MKVILKDFIFNGWHVDEYECDLPQLHDFEDLLGGKLLGHICGEIEDIINFNESFEEYKYDEETQ